MELKPCSLLLDIKLSEISTKIPSPIRSTLLSMGDLQLTIPFWKPPHPRLPPTPEEQKVLEDIEMCVKEWIMGFLEPVFPPEYFDRLVQHSVSYTYWLAPHYPVNTDKFKESCIMMTYALCVDDASEGKIDDEFILSDSNGLQNNFIQSFKLCTKFGSDLSDMAEFLKGKDPMTRMFGNAYVDIFLNIVSLERQEDIAAILTAFTRVGIADVMLKKGLDEGNLSKSRLRNFRDTVGGILISTESDYIISHGQLPPQLRRAPIFEEWERSADRIGACLNDLLGLKKDIRNGDTDSMICRAILNSTDPREAIMEEFQILSDAVKDYLQLRTTLLKEYKEFTTYIEKVDDALYGVIGTHLTSKRLGLEGLLTVVEPSEVFNGNKLG